MGLKSVFTLREWGRRRKESCTEIFIFSKKNIGAERIVVIYPESQISSFTAMTTRGRVAIIINSAQENFFPTNPVRRKKEDVSEWMDRYEKIGRNIINEETKVKKGAHVELSLTGWLRNGAATKGMPDNPQRIGKRTWNHQS